MAEFTVANLIYDQARLGGDRVALVDVADGREVTYRDLDAKSNRVAAALARMGHVAGDRVAYFGYNCVEFFELVFGAAKLGMTTAPLNWSMGQDQLDELVRQLGCQTAFVGAEFADRVRVERQVALGEEFTRWRDAEMPTAPDHITSPADVVLQPYTSGTTGVPKGVLITNENVEALLEVSKALAFDETSVQLGSMPNYHIGGVVFPMIALQAGGRLAVVNRFSVETVMDMIEQFRITNLNVVPTMLDMMLDEQQARPRDVSSVRLIVYGAAPVTARTVNRTKELLGVDLLQEYASTVCLAMTLLQPEDHVGERLKSVGRPFGGVELEVRDSLTGQRAAVGERGEIVARSAQCTQGYWNRADENAHLFTSDGFIRTADVGYFDDYGYLHLTGRAGDMIITGGENVYPAEIEAVLMTHPLIADVAVVGVPDAKWGELVTAVAVTNDSSLTAQDLVAWSRGQLVGYRRPRTVVLVDELPRNQTGKLRRGEVLDIAVSAVGS